MLTVLHGRCGIRAVGKGLWHIVLIVCRLGGPPHPERVSLRGVLFKVEAVLHEEGIHLWWDFLICIQQYRTTGAPPKTTIISSNVADCIVCLDQITCRIWRTRGLKAHPSNGSCHALRVAAYADLVWLTMSNVGVGMKIENDVRPSEVEKALQPGGTLLL